MKYNRCAYRKRKYGHTERPQGCWPTEERPCEHTVKRQPSTSQGKKPQENPTLANTLILNFYPLELREKRLLLFKLPNLWYFVMEVLAN